MLSDAGWPSGYTRSNALASGAHPALRALDRYVARRVEHPCTWWRTDGQAVLTARADVVLELPCTPPAVTALISAQSGGVAPRLGQHDVQMRMDVLRCRDAAHGGHALAFRQSYLLISPADEPMAVMAEALKRGSAHRLGRLERLLGLPAVAEVLGEGWLSRLGIGSRSAHPSWAVGRSA